VDIFSIVRAYHSQAGEKRYNKRCHAQLVGSLSALWILGNVWQQRADGLYFGHVNVWSDWALHIGFVRIFGTKNPADWLAYHPFYAGGKFTYPFFSHLISGLLLRAGWSLQWSLIGPSLVVALALIIGLYTLFWLLWRSRRVAVLAVSLFFLSSGPGFSRWLLSWISHPQWRTLWSPVTEFTRLDQWQWYSGNVIVGMLLPQRAFLFGLTMAIWAWIILLWQGHVRPGVQHWPLGTSGKQRWWLVGAGILAGLLPITHMHSFMALIILSGLTCLLSWRHWRTWLWYVVPAGLVSTVLFGIFIRGGIQVPDFMRWLPGWTNQDGLVGWLIMWWELWGMVWPITLVGWLLLWQSQQRWLSVLIGGFVLLFLISNLILLQPIPWDNSKFFLWTYLGFSGVMAYVISLLSRQRWSGWLLAGGFFILLSATGTLELLRLSHMKVNAFRDWSNEEMALGKQVAQSTPPLAIFLTTTSHNHWVMAWANRSIVMGFTPWATNFGFPTTQREADMKVMFAGGPTAEKLLKQYNVSYVVIGAGERFDFKANDKYYDQHYPVAFATDDTKVYKIQ
jgi:hypothetical protein